VQDISAAKYLGCSVLELEEAPLYWRERAQMAMAVEAEVRPTLEERERRKQARKK
jgi:hypothetical protein